VLDALVARLVDAGCRDDEPSPKAVRALGPRAQTPPDVVVETIGGEATIGQLIRHALARSVTQMIRHDAGVRLGEDPEDVHQFRVATRRLRSDLRTFAPLLAWDWVAGLRSELAWLGAQVGTVRDTDVLTERLQAQAESLPEQDAPAVAVLVGRLARQHDEVRTTMLAALRTDRYDTLLEALVAAANQPAFAPDALADRLARSVVGKLVRRPWRRLAGAVDAAGDEPSDDELHLIRIAAKRCRYAAEAASPVAGRPAVHFAAAVAGVQTVLGDHQDAIVAEAWLRAAAAENPGCGVAAGELVAVQLGERSRRRAAWPKTWHAASAKKLRTWF
jgi:CHAD domain-containing protein